MNAKKQGNGRRPSNGADVFGVLRERISTHALPPGSRLREQDLASEFGVSRARIREAFGALEQRGLIERIPNRGAVVVRLDPAQIYDLYDVRRVLEAYAARLAAERAPAGAWDDLIALFEAPLEKALAEGDLDAYLGGLERLHARMTECAGNSILADMLDLVGERTQVITRRVVILPGRAERGLRMHRELLRALAKGDADVAEAKMAAILQSARDYFEKFQKYVI